MEQGLKRKLVLALAILWRATAVGDVVDDMMIGSDDEVALTSPASELVQTDGEFVMVSRKAEPFEEDDYLTIQAHVKGGNAVSYQNLLRRGNGHLEDDDASAESDVDEFGVWMEGGADSVVAGDEENDDVEDDPEFDSQRLVADSYAFPMEDSLDDSLPSEEIHHNDFIASEETDTANDSEFLENPTKAMERNDERMLAISGTKADTFAGVWRHDAAEPYYIYHHSWESFRAQWVSLSGNGYRLNDIEIRNNGSSLLYSGVFVQGSGKYGLWVGASSDSFRDKWKEWSNLGYRLIDIEVYRSLSGSLRFAGVFREGNDAYGLWRNASWDSFRSKWQEWSNNGLRLIDLETYVVDGKRKYAGVFRQGSGLYGLWVGASWDSFFSQWKTWSNSGYRLIDFERYKIGSKTRFAGVFGPGTDSYSLWSNFDREYFESKDYELTQRGLHLVDLEPLVGYCSENCANNVVAPTTWIWRLRDEADPERIHAEYRWPVVSSSDKYVILGAVTFSNPRFYLPFSDTEVKLTGGWQYRDGRHHHALDYAKQQGASSFAVRAMKGGVVTYIGYSNWSGNVVEVSHDNDQWRTLYVHLRNGRTRDCEKAWRNSVPNIFNEDRKEEYITYLNTNSGCRQFDRQPKVEYWGTDSDTIRVQVGQVVSKGTMIGYAGNTGPGGKRGSHPGRNIHLHLNTVRKYNNKWYAIDPYGIYAMPSCYPSETTGKLKSIVCSRYSRAFALTSSGYLQYA